MPGQEMWAQPMGQPQAMMQEALPPHLHGGPALMQEQRPPMPWHQPPQDELPPPLPPDSPPPPPDVAPPDLG